MEAPEKIYIDHHPFRDEYEKHWYSASAGDKSVEYVRTDAFIEKAVEWLKSNLYDYAGEDDKRNIVPFDSSIFDDFKKYMRGE